MKSVVAGQSCSLRHRSLVTRPRVSGEVEIQRPYTAFVDFLTVRSKLPSKLRMWLECFMKSNYFRPAIKQY